MKRLGRTPRFRGEDGRVVPGSIAEVGYVRLGGSDQWVLIRGENLKNPPLILLYGGPGLSETAFFRYFNSSLEKTFTVVYWDQRGSGKSFDSKLARTSLTLERFLGDLDELVDAICRRLEKRKVTIFGHSWGSALGALYAARFPEKVAAYAGSGQIGDWAAAESASYAFALEEAARRGNQEALKDLREIGAPPYSAKALWTERTWLQRLEGKLGPRQLSVLARAFLLGPESSLLDMPNLLRGFRSSLDVMWNEVSRINLKELAPSFQMPVFFLLGRQDHWVPAETSLDYFEMLEAPSKRLVWFEESGHEPFVDEAAKFNASMVELVRPAAG